MVRILAAAALALTLPVAAIAASHTSGIDQIKEQIMNDPAMMGMDADLDGLTDEQITQIDQVLSGTDDQDTKQMKVKEIMGE